MCAARLQCRAICCTNTAKFLSLTILASYNKIMIIVFCKYSNKILVFQDLTVSYAGMPEPGMPGVPGPGCYWQPPFLADQLTLFQPGQTDFAHYNITGTPNFFTSHCQKNCSKIVGVSRFQNKNVNIQTRNSN